LSYTLIAGLGNPGVQYEKTRHNAGFMVVDGLAEKIGADFRSWQTSGVYAKVSIGGKEVLLAKPMTYMNLSGQLVSGLARFYKIPPEKILICFDDMSLNLGDIRLRGSGSAGGQKGMKHIIEQLGTDKIARLRVGIGPKPDYFDAADFVLGKFTKAETPLLENAVQRATEAVTVYLQDGLEKAMNRFN
jgi:PTH1 family peptidyl-tRNA hydrolase